MISESRINAYRFLLCAVMMHLKWDLHGLIGGFHWWNPGSLRRQYQQVHCARVRDIAFHNLAHFLTLGMRDFDEARFSGDLDRFQNRFPERLCNYKSLFERKLNGEEVSILGG